MQEAIDVLSAPLKKILILRDVEGVEEAPQRLSPCRSWVVRTAARSANTAI